MLSQLQKDLNKIEDNAKECQGEEEYEIPQDIECGYIQTQVVRVSTSKFKSNDKNIQQVQKTKGENIAVNGIQIANQTEEEKLCSFNEIPNELPNGCQAKNGECADKLKAENQNEQGSQNKEIKGEQLVEINEVGQDNQPKTSDIESQIHKSSTLSEKNQNDDNKSEEIACRICLDNESSLETGELLNICECKGSLQYIHRVCLWLQLSSKVKLDEFEKNDQLFKCELCKTPYRIQVGVKYALQPLDKFKAQIKDQLKPIIVFLVLAICSTIFSILLVDFINNEGVGKRKSAVGFMYYMFVSFVVTTAFISFFVLGYLFIRAAILKKVSLLQVFPKKEDYTSFQQRNRSRSRTTTAGTIQTNEVIAIQQSLPANNFIRI